MDLSICVPIYNAQGLIEPSVRQLIGVCESNSYDYEILLRDDGSQDKSRDNIYEIARRNPRVKSSHNESNQGFGYTLRKLFSQAGGDVLIYCDCDLPFGTKAIERLFNEIKTADIVVASRYCGGKARLAFTRRMASRLYYLLCRCLFRIPIKDIGSGTIALRKKIVEQLSFETRGFDFHAELYVKAAKAGFSLKEIPAQSIGTSLGSFRIWRHGLRAAIDTVILWQRINNEQN